MERRAFGATGIEVSALGLGAGELGAAGVSEGEAERLVGAAVDAGITFFDSARSYGASEERLGRALGRRRREVVLSTKGGYGVPGVADWTGAAVSRGVDDALARLRTDVIDVFHLHSCPRETLERGEVLGALEAARAAGKVRVVAYSGEGEALAFAVASGRVGAVQLSVSPFDQGGVAPGGAAERAAAAGLGVVGKRPLGNAPWRFAERPAGDYAEVYWERMRAMGVDPAPLAWDELCLRFAAFAPGVSTVIAGTARPGHLARNVAAVARGPLPADVVARVRAAFRPEWPGQIRRLMGATGGRSGRAVGGARRAGAAVARGCAAGVLAATLVARAVPAFAAPPAQSQEAAPASRVVRVVAAPGASCPSERAVADGIGRLLPRWRVVVGSGGEVAGAAEVRLVDDGARHRVEVRPPGAAPAARELADEARRCDERAQAAALFAALVLEPPAIPARSVAAPTLAAPPPRVRLDVEVGGLLALASVGAGGALAGGATAGAALSVGPLGVSIAVEPTSPVRVPLAPPPAAARLVRLPLALAARLALRRGRVEGALDVGATFALLFLDGEGVTGARSATRLDVALRARLALRIWIGARVAVAAGLSADVSPRPYELAASDAGPSTPAPGVWLAASGSLLFRLH